MEKVITGKVYPAERPLPCSQHQPNYHTTNRSSKTPRTTLRLQVKLERTHRQKNRLKTKEINWLIGKKFPSIYRKQITHLQGGNQTYMELRNKTVGLQQKVQHNHAEIPIQNSQSHSKCTVLCNKSYCTYRLQHHLRN